MLPRLVFEPTSPFVAKPTEDRSTVSANEHDPQEERPLVLELLAGPTTLIDRIIDRAAVEQVILTSIGTIILSLTFFALISLSATGALAMFRGAGLATLSTLLALAAAFGPIYAASLLLAARIPLARLVAIIVSSAATGSLILAACAPIPFFLMRLDRTWIGPLSTIAAFLLSGLISGSRIHRSLYVLAEKMFDGATLTPDAHHRVGVLARVAWMIVGFTLALGLWGFDALI